MKWIFLSVDGMFCYVCFQQYSLSSSLVFTEFLLIVKSFKNNCDSVKREVLIELGAFCHNSLKKWTLAGPCSCCLVYMSVFSLLPLQVHLLTCGYFVISCFTWPKPSAYVYMFLSCLAWCEIIYIWKYILFMNDIYI